MHRDPLCTEDLLSRRGKEGSGFDGRVVGDDHLPTAGDRADACDHSSRGGAPELFVHPPAGPQRKLEERASWVDEPLDSLAGGEPTLRMLPLDRLAPAAENDLGFLFSELCNEIGGHARLQLGRLVHAGMSVVSSPLSVVRCPLRVGSTDN